jgi:sarcosine oxidase
MFVFDGSGTRRIQGEQLGTQLDSEFDADVIVVGLGAMGSNAAWRLAERGLSVIGIDRFTVGHNQGSSHGGSRLFRVATLEHPNLVTVARRSKQLWEELERISGEHIIDITGAITIGPADGDAIVGTLEAARVHDLDITVTTPAEIPKYSTGHANVPDDYVVLWDPEAGVVRPEAGVKAAIEAAKQAGASIITDTRVTDIELVDDGAVVRTATSQFHARQIVVTAGAWVSKFLPELELRPLRVPMTWFKPKDPESDEFQLSRFPVFIRAMDARNWFWGHGTMDDNGVKVGLDWDPNYQWTDPDEIERGVSRRDWQLVSDTVRAGLPDLDPFPSKTTVCMVTHSPDGQFVIGRIAGDPRLVVGGGDSGHAFKHAAGIGELIAEIICGEPTFVDTAFVDPDRLFTTGSLAVNPDRTTQRMIGRINEETHSPT